MARTDSALVRVPASEGPSAPSSARRTAPRAGPWRSRIVGQCSVAPGELVANPALQRVADRRSPPAHRRPNREDAETTAELGAEVSGHRRPASTARSSRSSGSAALKVPSRLVQCPASSNARRTSGRNFLP